VSIGLFRQNEEQLRRMGRTPDPPPGFVDESAPNAADHFASSDEAGKEKRAPGLSFGVPMNSIPAASRTV